MEATVTDVCQHNIIKLWKEPEKALKKITGFIYLPGSQFYQADSNLKLKSCLHGDVINTALCVGKSINKNGFLYYVLQDAWMTKTWTKLRIPPVYLISWPIHLFQILK